MGWEGSRAPMTCVAMVTRDGHVVEAGAVAEILLT